MHLTHLQLPFADVPGSNLQDLLQNLFIYYITCAMQNSKSSCRCRQLGKQNVPRNWAGEDSCGRVATPAKLPTQEAVGPWNPGSASAQHAWHFPRIPCADADAAGPWTSSPSAVQHAVPFCLLVLVNPTPTRGRERVAGPRWWRFGVIREGWRRSDDVCWVCFRGL